MQLNGQGWLGLKPAQQAVSRVRDCNPLSRSFSYHPLVDLTPFSVATTWGVVRKLDRGRKCQEKHTITFHQKLLKRKNWVTFTSGIEFGFICGHAALLVFFLWVYFCVWPVRFILKKMFNGIKPNSSSAPVTMTAARGHWVSYCSRGKTGSIFMFQYTVNLCWEQYYDTQACVMGLIMVTVNLYRSVPFCVLYLFLLPLKLPHSNIPCLRPSCPLCSQPRLRLWNTTWTHLLAINGNS